MVIFIELVQYVKNLGGKSRKNQIKQEISLKKIFGGSQILTILTQLSDEIPLYSLSLHAGKGCSV